MNKQEIVTVLRELHRICGFRVSLHGADFEEIAAYPQNPLPFCRIVNEQEREHAACVCGDRAACLEARGKGSTCIYKCRYGLVEAVSPLYNFGALSGFLMMGQAAESREDAEEAVRRLSDICADLPAELPDSIPTVKEDMIKSYVRIMTICAEYLTLTGAVPGVRPTVAEQAKRYISENIAKKFVISDICAQLGCSKSTLLSAFKKKYGVTVNAYVTDTRLERARHLLTGGAHTISEIASETGFSDQSYFSKVFSAKYGMSPSDYRAMSRADKDHERSQI